MLCDCFGVFSCFGVVVCIVCLVWLHLGYGLFDYVWFVVFCADGVLLWFVVCRCVFLFCVCCLYVR